MYGGSPQQMLDSLRSLMQSIMTMYKIARYYGTPQRMTTLFQKITNQMMRGCKESILASGKIWDQEKTQLIANMKVRAGTRHSYMSVHAPAYAQLCRNVCANDAARHTHTMITAYHDSWPPCLVCHIRPVLS
jgi:dynein heavy chain